LPAVYIFKLNILPDISNHRLQKPVATIGIFDGVHIAHKAIINRLLEVSKLINGESLIVTLWPHPRILLQGGEPLKLITTLGEKIELLNSTGVENLLVLDFNKEMSETGFEDFVKNILVEKLSVQHLVVGFNHHFGRNREGNFEKLQTLSARYGFGLEQMGPVYFDNEKISSSLIRKLISNGEVKKAHNCMGHLFSIEGQVVDGDKIGRKIGFPTANLHINDNNKLFPGNGVYAVIVEIEKDIKRMGMMNIGYRPTLNKHNGDKTLEVHILNFEGNLYNKTLKISFIDKLREEKKFNSIDDLKIQLEKDRNICIQILSEVKIN